MTRLGFAFAAAAVLAVAACAVQAPPPAYEMCNSAGCGDNVIFVIDNAE